jgi:hypothetical protein
MAKKKNRQNQKFRGADPVLISAIRFSRESGLGVSLVTELLAAGELPFRLIRERRWILRSEALAALRKQTKPRPAAEKVHHDAAEIRPEA